MCRRLSSILPLVLAASLTLAPAVGAAHLACSPEAQAGLEIQPNGLAQRAGVEIQPGGLAQRAGVEIQPGGLLSGVEVEPNG